MADDHPIPKPRSKNPPPQSQIPTHFLSPPQFSHLLTQIAIAQICQSFGFKSAQSSALDSLTRIATIYIEYVGSRATTRAVSGGRSQCNLFDIIAALEDLSLSSVGFSGAGDVSRPLLGSYILKELQRFVNGVDEVPFARRIPRPEISYGSVDFKGKSGSLVRKGAEVPGWLPDFPEVLEDPKPVSKREASWEQQTFDETPVPPMAKRVKEEKKKKKKKKRDGMFLMKGRRERVRFRLGMGNDRKMGVDDLELRNGVCRGGKRVCLAKRINTFLDEDEEDGVRIENGKS